MAIRQVLSTFTFEQQRLMINNIGNDIGDLAGLPPTFSGKTLKDCFGTLYSGNTGINSVLYSPTAFSVAISGGTATNISVGLSTVNNSQFNNPTIDNGAYTGAHTYYGRITIASGTPTGGTRVTLDNRGDYFGVSLAVSSGVFNILTTTSGTPLQLSVLNGPQVILNSYGNLTISGNTEIIGSLLNPTISSGTFTGGTYTSTVLNTPQINSATVSSGTLSQSTLNQVNINSSTITSGTTTFTTVISGVSNDSTLITPQINSPIVSSGTINFASVSNCQVAGATLTTANLVGPTSSSGTFYTPVHVVPSIASPSVTSGTFLQPNLLNPTVNSGTFENFVASNDATFRGAVNIVSGNTTIISLQNGIGEIDIRDLASTPLTFPAAILNATKNVSGYTQINIQNVSSGNSSSADLVVTADNGTDSINYIDLGINSSTYNQAAFNISGANDGYLYINGGNLALGTASSGKTVVIHVGDTTAGAESVRIRAKGINATGVNTGTVSIQGGVSISGNTTILGAIHNPTVTSGTFNSPTINGPVFNAINITGPTTIASTVDYVFLAASSGYTVTLPTPAAVLAGRPLTLVRTDSTANTISVAGNINGSSVTNTTIFPFSQAGRRVSFVCNGSTWWTLYATTTSGSSALTSV